MVSISFNSAQSSQAQFNSTQPSFRAKMVATHEAKKVLAKDLAEFYSGCDQKARERFFGNEPFDFEQIFNRFKNVVENATKDIDPEGAIEIVPGKKHKGVFSRPEPMPEIIYKDSRGIIVSHKDFMSLAPTEILPHWNEAKPMEHSLIAIVARLSMIMSKNGSDYGKNNKYAQLMNNLGKADAKYYENIDKPKSLGTEDRPKHIWN